MHFSSDTLHHVGSFKMISGRIGKIMRLPNDSGNGPLLWEQESDLFKLDVSQIQVEPMPVPNGLIFYTPETIGLEVARQYHVQAWRKAIVQHQHHPSFEPISDPIHLEIGFSCSCTGERLELRVNIRDIKLMVPEIRERIQTIFSHIREAKARKRKRKARKAEQKAKALLFRYLTKQQKWALRAYKYFEVQGQDGQTYRIHSEQWHGNVHRIDQESHEATHSFCAVPKTDVTELPQSDLMLAHKVMLENDIEYFMSVANIRNILQKPVEVEDDGYQELERQQAHAIEERRAVAQGIGKVLCHDICVNE